MRTEEEIKERIKIYEKIKDMSAIFTSAFIEANGAITALEWVLESEEE